MIKEMQKELKDELENLFESKAEDFIAQASLKFSNQSEELESFAKKIEELIENLEYKKEDFNKFFLKIDNVKKIETKINAFNKINLEVEEKIVGEAKETVKKTIKQTINSVEDEVQGMVETFNSLKEDGEALKENVENHVSKMRAETKKQKVNLKKYINKQMDVLREEMLLKVNEEIEESKQMHKKNKGILEEMAAKIKELENATINNVKFSKKYNK